MKTKSNILILGASGFIGQHIVKHLANSSWKVYAQCLPNETPSSLPDVIWLPCDLRNANCVQTWPEKCDSIIYLAQSPEWRVFPDGAKDVFEVNVAAVIRTIEYARNVEAQHFIFASSGSVYDQTTQPSREDDRFDIGAQRNFYAASKLATELLIKPYTSLMSIINLRLFSPYGLGLNPKMLISQLVHRVQERKAIDLHGKDGMQINPVAVADVTRVLERCLTLENSATFNVAGPDRLTLRRVSEIIGLTVGIAPQFTAHPEQRVPVLVGDTTALLKQLGWAPQIPFETGIRAWLES